MTEQSSGTRHTHVTVKGAREHNLQNVDLQVPRDALVTFTGVSGSGKSSLAHNTIYQEGQRRFLESLSSYARQFLGKMEKPKVDVVDGLSPTVSIDQKSVGHSPRSTVGTLTEIADFLRLLYSRLGTPACPVCGAEVEAWSTERIIEAILHDFDQQKALVLAPVIRERKGEYRKELEDWRRSGFVRARIDGEVRRLDEEITLDRYKYHTIELVVDRLTVRHDERSRLAESVEQALELSAGSLTLHTPDNDEDSLFSTARACPNGHGALPELEPRLFSFNSPIGACETCDGLGLVHSVDPDLLLADASKSIRDGALFGFNNEGRLMYGRLGMDHLEEVAEAFEFNLETPWEELTAKQQKVVMYGSGSKRFQFRWQRSGKNTRSQGSVTGAWPGIVPHLEHAYRGSTARHLDRFRNAHTCDDCDGTRLNALARSVQFEGRTLPEVMRQPVADLRQAFDRLQLTGSAAEVAREILREIQFRLRFLDEVGLGYLTLERRANTLSGGESQRIRLAAQVGAGLRGVLYVLDEPSIGLHARDHRRLIGTLKALRDRGNTVLVVEHDEQTMEASDWLVDVGPGAGVRGGEVVASGPPAEVREGDSLTARYLRGDDSIEIPEYRRVAGSAGWLRVKGAEHHNLKKVDADFPLGCFVVVTGVSGSGKSTLVNHILKKALRRALQGGHDVPGKHKKIEGLEELDKIVEIDQSPIGRTPRSNPATYTKLWDEVRNLFAELPEARTRGYTKSRFSFNVAGGRCPVCEGAGVKTLEMQFLAPVEIECEACEGSRFDSETLDVLFKGHSVADLLAMSIDDALELFKDLPKIKRPLQTLQDVGLGYLTLGQPSTTLSGGEAQRVKLASELQRPATGRTLYVLDEPTTGLHFEDVRKLLKCLQALVDAGNTVIVIEHDLDVIKSADWILDMGPEGGPGGGTLVVEGSPEEVAECDASHTGAALRPLLAEPEDDEHAGTETRDRLPTPTHLEVRGASKNNLKHVDLQIPLDTFTVVTGPSGSGKTSLAFDTLFSEGQRRFVESLSTYARRFLGRLDRAPVDALEGIGPAIAIDQKAASRSPRSTVATATEIQDYLRLLYARVGRAHCPDHGHELKRKTPGQVAGEIIKQFDGERGYVLAPWPGIGGGSAPIEEEEREERRQDWKERGFARALVDGEEHRLEQPFPDDAKDILLVVDRTTLSDRKRLAEAVALACEESGGRAFVRTAPKEGDPVEARYSSDGSCPDCAHRVPDDPHPRWFSFNHHSGACPTCAGLGRVIQGDVSRLVNHPDKPLFQGGIKHKGAAFTFLTKKNGYWAKVARKVGRAYGFSIDTPWNELTPEAQHLLMRGTGEERFPVKFSKRGRSMEMDVRWRGLCGQIERWYHGHEAQSSLDALRPVMREDVCHDCGGARLGRSQRHVFFDGASLPEFTGMRVDEALERMTKVKLRKRESAIAQDVLRELRNRLHFLAEVGLGYLNLNRSAATLSGGEAQRIRLATQLGNRLVGVLYVLDEPTIGLHPRDTDRLLGTLQELRDLGNTVVAVEHDEDVIRTADFVVDMGPGAGHHGGTVVAAGTPQEVSATESKTGRYLRGDLRIEVPTRRRESRGRLILENATTHNLKDVSVELPLGVLCAVTGVSGSGKSSLIMDTLLPQLETGEATAWTWDSHESTEEHATEIETVVVDQSPIGTTPSSNPATYTGVFTEIRELFSKLPMSRTKGFKPGRFSFNVRGGRCDACEGKGQIRVEMHFLADVWVTCDVCKGRRYNQETLQVELKGKSIADVLDLEIEEALAFFHDHPKIRRPLQLLCDVGLGYLKLGQSATTLSGGEAQRLKLVSQLQRKPQGEVLYVLDEPTTGLHLDDVRKLVDVLQRLVERGESVLVIEHHLDVIKCADWVVELGPEAGPDGGELVFEGTPEAMAKSKRSQTGPFLGERLVPKRRVKASAKATEEMEVEAS